MPSRFTNWLVAGALILGAACAPTPEQLAINHITAALKSREPDVALPIADAHLQRHPDSLPVRRLRVLVLLKLGALAEALTTVQSLPAHDPTWEQALNASDADIRISTARLIADQPAPPVSAAALINRLEDPEPAVRSSCAHAVGKLRVPAALKPLFRLLADDHPAVRGEAALALGMLGDRRAVGWFVRNFNDGDAFVRASITTALRNLADESTHPLLRAAYLKTPPAEQFSLAVALAKLGDPVSLAPLTNALTQTNRELRLRAVAALADLPPALVTNTLLKLTHDSDPSVRAQASLALKQTSHDLFVPLPAAR